MEYWQAFILGIVEGITEYLPVSSTGHLLLVQRVLGIGAGDAANAFAIFIQGGAIAAVLVLYWSRVQQMFNGMLGRDAAGFRLSMNIVAGFLPAAFIGLSLEGTIKRYLFGEMWGLWPVVIAWFIGGVAILAAGWYRRDRRQHGEHGIELDELTWKLALIIGFAQCIAMWPGTSRSLVTIVAGILIGMRLKSAVEFSFLLGVVTLSAATAHDAYKYRTEMLSDFGALNLIIGFIAAWISAMLAIKWLVTYISSHGLAIFGYYRIILAIVVAGLIWAGVMREEAPPDAMPVPGLATELDIAEDPA